MFLLLVGEKVFVPVSVSDLLWGRRVTLWDRVRDHYRHIVPNDTWFGLMYRVGGLHLLCLYGDVAP